jgi:ubiquinone/menaquinone biosynthesis C-methylase UbiE
MNNISADVMRIVAEYDRRAAAIPRDFYCWSKPPNLLTHCQTLRACIRALTRGSLFPLDGRRIADIGCGIGSWLLEFIQWGADPADLAGIDLMPARVSQARARIPQADLRIGGAHKLHWPDESFDLVTQFTVFSSMLDPLLKTVVALEMVRVLKPGGAILWFDLRVDNPANPHVRGIAAREIRRLFAGCQVTLASAVLAPPVTRRVAGQAWALAELLGAVPFLHTHYAGLILKEAN